MDKPIEKDILPLVNTLQSIGYKTIASCQGHFKGEPDIILDARPYVYAIENIYLTNVLKNKIKELDLFWNWIVKTSIHPVHGKSFTIEPLDFYMRMHYYRCSVGIFKSLFDKNYVEKKYRKHIQTDIIKISNHIIK